MSSQRGLSPLHGISKDITKALEDPSFFWQLAALFVALAIATLIRHYFNKKYPVSEAETAALAEGRLPKLIGLGAFKYIAFPLTMWVLLAIARPFVANIGSVSLLDLVIPFFLGLSVIRIILYILIKAFPRRWRWIIQFRRGLNVTVWGILILYVTGFDQYVIDALESISFSIGRQKLNLWIILHGLLAVALNLLFALWIAGIIESRLRNSTTLDSNVRVVLVRISQALLALIAIFSSLAVAGIDITALSVFGGALGVGLGFGLQKIASNYVSGFIILLDRSIRLGNLVSLDASTTGIVTQITTRYTVVRSLGGIEYIVPNETLVANIVQNQSWSDSMVRAAINLQVAYSTDIEQAMKIMEEIARNHPRVLASPAPAVMLTGFGDNGINLELGFWIGDPQEGTGGVRSQINLEIWKAFRTASIEFPFPQREVRVIGVPADMSIGTACVSGK